MGEKDPSRRARLPHTPLTRLALHSSRKPLRRLLYDARAPRTPATERPEHAAALTTLPEAWCRTCGRGARAGARPLRAGRL